MQLRKIAERAGAELRDDFLRLLFHQRPRAFLQLCAKAFRELVHLPHKLRSGHNRRSRHNRIFFGLGAHAQFEIFHFLPRQLALHKRLFGKLVEQPPRHPFSVERIAERRRVLTHFVEEFNRPFAVARFAAIAKAMGVDTSDMDEEPASQAAIQAIKDLSKTVGIPSGFAGLGGTEADLPTFVTKAQQDPCAPGNPAPMTDAQVLDLYRKAL